MNPIPTSDPGSPIARAPLADDLRSSWRATLPALGAGLLALLLLHHGTFGTMVDTWRRSETFAHGFLVAPIAAYLVWAGRRRFAAILPAPNPWGLAALAALSLGWLVGWAANVLAVQQLCAVLMIPAIVTAIAGPAVARSAAFPLGYLLFAVPVGEVLVPALTEFTARFTVAALRLVGVPVSEAGLYLNVPGASWEVSKACSGIRYLIASVAVGSLFAYLNYRTLKRRLAFVGVSIVAPILANGTRAFGIVILAYLTDGKLAAGIDHILYGWVFFAVVTLLLFWVGIRWREPEAADASRPAALEPAHGARRLSAKGRAVAGVLTVAALAAAPLAARLLDAAEPDAASFRPAAPVAAAPWSGPLDTADDWRPHFENPADELRSVYRRGSERVELYAASYGHERQGSELINAKNRVFDPEGWRRVGEREREIGVGAARLRVVETDLLRPVRGGARRRLAWHWYLVAGAPTTNPYAAKVAEAKARLLGRWGGSAVVVVAADYREGPDEAARLLDEFLMAHGAALRDALTRPVDSGRG